MAFDRSLSRLGYGKGFYDRFLASYASPPAQQGRGDGSTPLQPQQRPKLGEYCPRLPPPSPLFRIARLLLNPDEPTTSTASELSPSNRTHARAYLRSHCLPNTITHIIMAARPPTSAYLQFRDNVAICVSTNTYATTYTRRPATVALALREQILDAGKVPAGELDWRVDMIVGPDGVVGAPSPSPSPQGLEPPEASAAEGASF